MSAQLSILCGLLFILCLCLACKVWILRTGIREIRRQLSERLRISTNTLLTVPGNDRQLKKLASALNRELRALRDARLRYEQGDQELKDAVANLSHDLRTPLTSICGYLDLLENTEKSPQAERYLELVRNRADFLRKQLEELFGYSLAASAPEGEPELLSLNSVLEESLAAFYGAMAGRRITPDISMPEKRVERYVNRSALLRVFGNIISNALKYSKGDLAVVMDENGNISFSNHAEGLDAVSVDRLFDRFYTVESARHSTGLGLSIARLLTEQMGGTIGASLEGDVLTITLSLPA